MAKHSLRPHPHYPPGAIDAVEVDFIMTGRCSAELRFLVKGDGLSAPVRAVSKRADDLWKTTCFEAFLRVPGTEAYREWNFAPSGEWAAYDFTTHRDGRTNPDVATPYIRVEDNFTWWAFGATITVAARGAWEFGLSAVLEETDGTKSYWALAHPDGEKPDFHDAVCFAAHLP